MHRVTYRCGDTHTHTGIDTDTDTDRQTDTHTHTHTNTHTHTRASIRKREAIISALSGSSLKNAGAGFRVEG